MVVRALVFDMDGTLLDTLPDLALAANEALRMRGYPIHSLEEYESFMGNGAQRLIELAVPPGTPPTDVTRTFELWRNLYLKSSYACTRPFPGIEGVLRELRMLGIKTGILSNKFDAGVQALTTRYFPGLFDFARGEVPPTPRKPDPTSLLQMLAELNVSPNEAAYVGDTNIDVQTARNAGVAAVGVAWGYAKTNPLHPDELDAYLHHPAELLDFSQSRPPQ